MTIGMLATIVIMQVFSAFESQQRATTGTSDAQTNGNIALYTIGRDIQQAAYPLFPAGAPATADSAIECTTLSINGAAAPIDLLAPVVIADETGNGGDSITIHYGNSGSGGIPAIITSETGATANERILESNFGCRTGDTTLIVNGATCDMSSASAVAGTTQITLTNTTGAVLDANLSCLGTWNEITYAANNENLERTLSTPTVTGAATPTVAGIVNIQAQYGISDAANSNAVTAWVDAAGGTWAAPSVVNRNRIKAIRVAVVARNVKKEQKNLAGECITTSQCSSLNSASPTGLCAWEGTSASPAPSINLSGIDSDWLCYRYRVFETIIPLRTVIWSRGTL